VLTLIESYPHFSNLEVLHCHDWHTGVLLTLLHHDKRYGTLKERLKTLFTIHNLHYQGVRPFSRSGPRPYYSFRDWFPALYSEMAEIGRVSDLQDPRIQEACFNPMRAGILLADRINTVSPTYAEEITRPDNKETHFFGGGGLEADLKKAKQAGRLTGILNAVDYNEYNTSRCLPPFEPDLPGFTENRPVHKAGLLRELKQHIEGLQIRPKTVPAIFSGSGTSSGLTIRKHGSIVRSLSP